MKNKQYIKCLAGKRYDLDDESISTLSKTFQNFYPIEDSWNQANILPGKLYSLNEDGKEVAWLELQKDDHFFTPYVNDPHGSPFVGNARIFSVRPAVMFVKLTDYGFPIFLTPEGKTVVLNKMTFLKYFTKFNVVDVDYFTKAKVNNK